MDISQLQFRDKNPRLIKAENLEKLKNSIKDDPDFLTKRKILVNDTKDWMIVYAGNQRLRSLLALWYTEVPDEWIDIEKNIPLKLMEKRAFKDNVEYGEYDHDKLKDFDLEFLKELDLPEWELDLSELNDIDLDEEKEDSVPEPAKEAKLIEIGDIIQLWPHRIMCGDSTNIKNIETLQDGKLFDMVITDPPYNTWMTWGSEKAWLSQMFNDSYTDEERAAFMNDFVGNYYMSMKEDAVAYICLDRRRNHELIAVIKANWFHLSNIIVWDKVVHWLGSDYKYTYELINVCKKGNPTLNTHQWDREYSDVRHIQRKIGKDDDHATKKPIELCERPINHASKAWDIIWDLFLGSWSTLIACEKTNRVCYWMELDPVYIEVIIKRYHEYTKWAREIKCLNRDLDLTQLYAQ